ncbi:MAG: cell division protein ZapA [Deltaproteobacteria bacterium]|nr:cell division protein ZapA [Deltaproteobacteria bacterium]
MKNPVEVEIMGQNVTLRSEEEESYVRRVAGYVDEKMQEVLKTTRPIAKFNVAVMAALNIADEYHRLKGKYDTTINRLDLLSKRLSITLTEEG